MIIDKQKRIYEEYANKDLSFFDFVRNVNEIYHDVEGGSYEDVHPEIYKEELLRWNNLAKKYFYTNKKKNILDIGSGTGFVAQCVCKYLKKEDTFVFSDVSKELLEYCFNKFNGAFDCRLEFKKINSDTLDFQNNRFDVVTLNSVLHHIPDTEKILKEIDRVMVVGGKLIIGHEVNVAFFNNKILWNNYKILRLLSNKNFLLEGILKRIGFSHRISSGNKSSYDDILCERVSAILIEKNVANKPLSPSKMGLIVDIYSSIGFDINDFTNTYLPNFRLVEKETYNHLNNRPSNFFMKIYEKVLATIFPHSGKSFTVVLEKIS